jgi:uncharacterized protein (DUF1015 family)
MITISAFKALRPQPQLAKLVASRPYDVLTSAEARQEVIGNPDSFLHITKSEVDLPETTDIHTDVVYQKAAENLQAFIKKGVLFQEDKPCLYIYELTMNGRTQTGLVAGSSVNDYENNLIKKHEFTRPEKEQDRINHIATTRAQTGNVFLAYRNNAGVDAIIAQWKQTKSAVYKFTAEDGIAHAIWVINNDDTMAAITQLFATEVPCTYIADGHHRAASAAKVRAALGTQASEESNYFLTTLFPANELYIMDYNRVVKDLNGHTPEEFLHALAEKFTITPTGKQSVKPAQAHEIGLYVAGQWYQLHAKENTFTTDAIGVLDVTILQNNIFTPLLNIVDQRTDKRVDFVGGIRGIGELEKRVDSGDMAAAFSLYPVSIEQLFTIADTGNVMPPKSTWFEPKLRDGLLTHLI